MSAFPPVVVVNATFGTATTLANDEGFVRQEASCQTSACHFRTDYPAPDDDNWRRHLTIQVDVDGGHPKAGEIKNEEPITKQEGVSNLG